MSEKVKIVPNPEAAAVEEETESKPKFPTKLVRNIVIGAVGVAIAGYVACKIKSKDEDEDASEAAPWIDVFVPTQSQENASGE